MKERIIAIFLLLLAAITVWALATELPKKEYAQPASNFSDAIREGSASSPAITPAVSSGSSAAPFVSAEVIRLHILADSDSNRDQSIKLTLRDILLPYLNAAALGASSKEEALTQLKEQCSALTDIANAALAQLGADYTATVSVENLYFPIRIYGSQTYLSQDAVIFPPGFYDSVQVVLGDGNGHNWWCLAYPSLCFIDSAYDYIPKDSDIYKLKIGSIPQKKLKELFYGKEVDKLFPEETYNETADDNSIDSDTTIYFSFKLWELVTSLFQKGAK